MQADELIREYNTLYKPTYKYSDKKEKVNIKYIWYLPIIVISMLLIGEKLYGKRN